MLLKVSTNAPNFNLPNQNGETISLSDLKGKKVVLWFYPKANTPGWTIEGQGFRDEFKQFEDKNIVILGVSADPVSKQKKFCDKQGFLYDLLSDESHSMLEDYGVWGKKKFMGREYMGISRITYIIDENGKIEHVIEKVKTMSHAKDMLNILEEWKIWWKYH